MTMKEEGPPKNGFLKGKFILFMQLKINIIIDLEEEKERLEAIKT